MTRRPLPYHSYRDFLLRNYGEVLQRVPIDIGSACPHRGEGRGLGCIYCPADGARSPQTLGVGKIEEQVLKAGKFASQRY
ncbi:MAG: TIGR01212 family radical SAM protein, partial [Planctomycetes bacterium]|nr:TIGR01212 family radical SAM protein [Planctomycetota bacterium]